jgi:hypothetical protein
MKLVYICHPYEGDGDPTENRAAVAKICREIIESDPETLPIAPQLYLYRFANNDNTTREKIMEYCISLLGICEEMWVYGDIITPGMKEELAQASKPLFSIPAVKIVFK